MHKQPLLQTTSALSFQ